MRDTYLHPRNLLTLTLISSFLLYYLLQAYVWEWSITLNFFLAQQDVLDPPEDCFRIRLIITLLQTCGHYFTRGSSKRKLDKFLLHFQRYIIMKGPLPLDIEFDIQVSFFLMYNFTTCINTSVSFPFSCEQFANMHKYSVNLLHYKCQCSGNR